MIVSKASARLHYTYDNTVDLYPVLGRAFTRGFSPENYEASAHCGFFVCSRLRITHKIGEGPRGPLPATENGGTMGVGTHRHKLFGPAAGKLTHFIEATINLFIW